MTSYPKEPILLQKYIGEAQAIRGVGNLAERTKRSVHLAKLLLPKHQGEPVSVSGHFINYVLGTLPPAEKRIFSDDHQFAIHQVESIRERLKNAAGELIAKVELQIPYGHTKPVMRPTWVGVVAGSEPRYEMSRMGGAFNCKVQATVLDPTTGNGMAGTRFVGDSEQMVPMFPDEREHEFSMFSFMLSRTGIGVKRDTPWPQLVIGREMISHLVNQENPQVTEDLNFCLTTIAENARSRQNI